MTSEEAREYLEYLLSAYTALMKADANYKYPPFGGSKLPQVLRELQEEIQITRRIAKQIIRKGDN